MTNPGALHHWILALPETGRRILGIVCAAAGVAVAAACLSASYPDDAVVRNTDGTRAERTSTLEVGGASPGAPIPVTDAIGTVKHEVETTAFGLEARTAGGPVDNFRWHTGQPRSASLGLVGMPHRWMNPLTTEFLSPDPAFSDERAVDALLQPHRMHPFRYAHGDPLTSMDRSGEWVESAIDVTSLGVGIADIAANGANVWNVTGVVVDAVALAVPFVPGGASLAIKGGRAAYNAYLGSKAANLAQNSVTAGRAVGTAARQADAGKAIVEAAGASKGGAGRALGDVPASTPVGRKGSPMDVTRAPTPRRRSEVASTRATRSIRCRGVG